MAQPIVAIVGRPNVGKSTLFNRLIGERRAVVHDIPGTTRDRNYGTAEWRGREFTVVDTGGIGLGDMSQLLADVTAQAEEAIREADAILFVVDAVEGVNPIELDLSQRLRRAGKPVILVANKADNRARAIEAAEFYQLGLGEPIAISALNGLGTGDMLDQLVAHLPLMPPEGEVTGPIGVAIVGRPNVGKSSLLNALLGRPRAIVSEIPGTTRDAIDTPIQFQGRDLVLIDTAGIRRRGRIEGGVEKYSVLRALRAIDRAEIAALLIDAAEGVTAQDSHIAGYIHEAAKGLILVLNKWDLVEKQPDTAAEYTALVRRALTFVDYAPIVFVSAKTGQRVTRVLEEAIRIADERDKRVPTSALNNLVAEVVAAHPHAERGKRLKIYYVTQTGVRPLLLQ